MELSIIIPVYKESESIESTLDHLFSLSIPLAFEVIVVDGEPAGSTLKVIETRHAGKAPRCRLKLIPSAKGRGTQMNAGAAAALGRLFFFLHADTRLTQAGLDQMVTVWKRRNSSRFCGAFDLSIDSPEPWFRIIEKTASLRSRLTRIPYGDQGLFISRQLFEAAGGFPDVPLMEDVGLMAAVKRQRVRPLFLGRHIRTSARRWKKQGVVFSTLRNWILICLWILGVSPHRLDRFY